MTDKQEKPAEVPALNTPADAPMVSLDISVDRSLVTLGDMRFMIKMRTKKEKTTIEDAERIFDFLERVIIGGIEKIPFDAMEQVMEAVFTQMNPESEIKN